MSPSYNGWEDSPEEEREALDEFEWGKMEKLESWEGWGRMNVRLMRWLVAAVLLAALHASAAAQSLDSVRTDSLLLWTVSSRSYYTKVVVQTDSLYWTGTEWSKTKPLADVAKGVLFGGYRVPADSLGSIYNMIVLGGSTPYKDLAKVKAKSGHAVLNIPASKSTELVNGVTTLSVAAAKRFLATWPDSASLNPYFRDGTILAVTVLDDVTSKASWGSGASNWNRMDSLGLAVKQRYGPTTPTALRATPTVLMGTSRPAYSWRWINYAWGQYAAYARLGDVVSYRKLNVAQADSIKLCMMWGVNINNGGNGSSGVPGDKSGTWRMTGAEIATYAAELAPYGTAFVFWEYGATNADLLTGFKMVRAMADSLTPRRACP
jgi:hypothetical protein